MPLVRSWGDMNPIAMIDGYTSPFGDAAASRGGRRKRSKTMAKKRSLMRACHRQAKHKTGAKYRSALKKCLKAGWGGKSRRRRRR